MTIRSRIVTAIVVMLAIALFLVVALSTILVRNAFRNTLNESLRTTATALAGSIDIHKGRLDVDSGDLQEIARMQAASHLTLIDNRGRVVAGERPPRLSPRAIAKGGLFAARERGRTVRVAVAPISTGTFRAGSVIAWRTDDYIDDAVRDTLLVSGAVALIVLLLGLIVARRVADSVVSPVNAIAEHVERIEERDLSLRLGAPGSDELGRLAASFDRMLDRLQAAFSREREFTADASHELRAPLAVLRAEVELALRRPRSEQEYRDALEGAMREIERLETLVDNLLAAARAEIDSENAEPVDLRSLADDVVMRTLNAARVKSVQLTASGENTSIVGDPVGLESALLAIVHNAVTHAPEHGNVTIVVSRVNGCARIAVRDSGPGFSETALANASKRFWRGDDSRPRGGTGLGLSIADAFVRANGGKLGWQNEPGGGAVVTMDFDIPG